MRAFQIPGTMRQLRWWLAVQSVYAREIGESFAKPQNDNGKAGRIFPTSGEPIWQLLETDSETEFYFRPVVAL